MTLGVRPLQNNPTSLPNDTTIPLNDFGYYISRPANETIPVTDNRIIFKFPKSLFARKNLTFKVAGKKNPISIMYFFPTDSSLEQNAKNEIESQIKREKKELKSSCKAIFDDKSLPLPGDDEIEQIFLTRCCHLIYVNNPRNLPKTCPECDQDLSSNAPFVLNKQHFASRLVNFKKFDQVISLLDAPILGSFIPENVKYKCSLSNKVIKDKPRKLASFIATPCGHACDKETYLTDLTAKEILCKFCNKTHEINHESTNYVPQKERQQLVFLKKRNITPITEDDLMRRYKKLNKKKKETFHKTTLKALPTGGKDTENIQYTFHLSRIFDHFNDKHNLANFNSSSRDDNTLFEVESISNLLITPCCHTILHHQQWKDRANEPPEKKEERVYKSKKYQLGNNPQSIQCPQCHSGIDIRSKKERRKAITEKWLNRAQVVGFVALGAVGIVSIFAILYFQAMLLQSIFPFAAIGFHWEALATTVAVPSIFLAIV